MAKIRSSRNNGRPRGITLGPDAEPKNRFRAAYKKSVKLMQDAIGLNETGEAKFPGNQTGNSGMSEGRLPPPQREAAKALQKTPDQTTHAVNLDGVLQDIAWSPQPGPQTALLTCPVEDIFFGGARGGGKGLYVLTGQVLTPFGFKSIRDIKVGSNVCAVDGTVTKVIGVYPKGKQAIYRCHFSDGASVDVDADHIWQGWRVNQSVKKGGVRTSGVESTRNYSMQELVEFVGVGRKRSDYATNRLAIPVTSPVAYTVAGELVGRGNFVTRPMLAPYILGVLLGDGCLTNAKQIKYCSADKEIPDRIVSILPPDAKHLGPYGNDDVVAKSYGINSPIALKLLTDLGLMGHGAASKFIPRIYKMGSVDERFELLRGLMDTDGWMDKDGDIYYCTISARLADDVRELAMSLGAVVTTREKIPTYTKHGEKFDGQKAYTLRIKLRDNNTAFALQRKKRSTPKVYQSFARYMERIERIEDGESICIAVAHPSSLFITNDFIVTHNSDALLGDWLMHRERYGGNCRGILFRRTYTELEELIQRSLMIYPSTGAQYSKAEHTWFWPDGAILRLRYLEADEDAARYQGHNFTWQGFDEIGQFPSPKPIDLLWATLRSAAGIPCVRRSTGNPGGPGTQWIKERYIDPSEPWVPFKWAPIKDRPDLTIESVFIPSRLEDNVKLMVADPRYEMRLAAINDPEMFKAWREGDWTVLAGRYFSTFHEETCVAEPVPLPPWLPRWISVDWGYAHNSAVYWGAYDGERVIIYDELLVNEKTPVDLAKLIVRRTALNSPNSKIAKLVLSPDAFSRRSSNKTIASEMAAIIPWSIVQADNDRIGGWNLMRQMFAFEQLKIFNVCQNLIKKLKVAQRDPKRPEDVLKHKGDDEIDSARYLVKTGDMRVVVPEDIIVNDAIKKYLDSGEYMNAFVEKLRLKDAMKKRKKPLRIGGAW